MRRVELTCNLPSCSKSFSREISQVSVRNFCSHSCRAKYSNPLRIRSRPEKRCKYCNKIFYKDDTFCSVQCGASNRRLSKEYLLSHIKELAEKLGRSPSRREYPQYSSCVKYFGSWNNALIQAGLQPNRSLNQRMYRRRVCFAQDGHLCNSISEMIIDNWLHDHSISHQKEVPYPTNKYVADWLIGKDIFVEYFGLAKDSKRYDLSIEKKRKVCREAGVRLIEIFPKDLFPKNDLDHIFIEI